MQQDEIATLEAELRAALQHRHAAYERLEEMQRELSALHRRAAELLVRVERLRRGGARPEQE